MTGVMSEPVFFCEIKGNIVPASIRTSVFWGVAIVRHARQKPAATDTKTQIHIGMQQRFIIPGPRVVYNPAGPAQPVEQHTLYTISVLPT